MPRLGKQAFLPKRGISFVKLLICRIAYTLSMIFLETMGTICGVICVALYRKFEFAIKTI